MIINKTAEGAWCISSVIDGHLSTRVYFDYTRSEAIHKFLEEHHNQRSLLPMLDYEDEPCRHCGALKVIYHQYIGDARCESCGRWAGEEDEPGPTNEDRANTAYSTLLAYNSYKGGGNGDHADDITDLLTDLRHLCDQTGEDFNYCLRVSQEHHIEEKSDEQT